MYSSARLQVKLQEILFRGFNGCAAFGKGGLMAVRIEMNECKSI